MSMKDSKEALLERIKKLEYEMACMEATHKRQYEADFENYEATVKRQVASYKALNSEQQRRIGRLQGFTPSRVPSRPSSESWGGSRACDRRQAGSRG
jgi:hypothetical protein